MDFNDLFLPKIESIDQQCGAGKMNLLPVEPISNSHNHGDDLASIDRQVDGLLTKVDKLEVDLNTVEHFYANNARNQINGPKDSHVMRLRANPVPSIKKKNQTRAVTAKRTQEKKLQQDKGSQDPEPELKPEEQLALEVAHARMARNLRNELNEVDVYLEQLRESVLQKDRKFSVEEKRKLGAAFAKLTPENVVKALEIVAQSNPNITGAAEVDLDMDALSLCTLWRLRIFVKNALKIQASTTPPPPPPTPSTRKPETEDVKTINNKRKKKFSDVAKPKRPKTEPVGN